MSSNNPSFPLLSRLAKLTAIAFLTLGFIGIARADTKTGDVFPALSSADLEGGEIPAATGKVVLVDFWASWCAPCRESFPRYGQLQADYAARGLLIVAVSVDQNARAFSDFVKKMKPSFSTLRDKNQRLVQAVNVPVMPTCYLVGRDGRVHSIHAGFYGVTTERDLRREIDQLLSETSPAS